MIDSRNKIRLSREENLKSEKMKTKMNWVNVLVLDGIYVMYNTYFVEYGLLKLEKVPHTLEDEYRVTAYTV